MVDLAYELAVRQAAFSYLATLSEGGERAVHWRALQSFRHSGELVHLASQQGIFKPRQLDLPISIRTTPPGADGWRPYDDEITDDEFVLYRYRRGAHGEADNRLLRVALDHGVPLIYLHGVAKGLYMVHGASIIEDYPAEQTVSVALSPIDRAEVGTAIDIDNISKISRGYYLRIAKQRAGQATFRESVLAAYRHPCTICRLRHTELLDAAHIIPDSEEGPLVVTNGLSLCKIHHAAYDTNILGVRPDHVTEIREDILEEVDGPMLRHGLQEVHGRQIVLPRSATKRPDPVRLERRYEKFRAAS